MHSYSDTLTYNVTNIFSFHVHLRTLNPVELNNPVDCSLDEKCQCFPNQQVKYTFRFLLFSFKYHICYLMFFNQLVLL